MRLLFFIIRRVIGCRGFDGGAARNRGHVGEERFEYTYVRSHVVSEGHVFCFEIGVVYDIGGAGEVGTSSIASRSLVSTII